MGLAVSFSDEWDPGVLIVDPADQSVDVLTAHLLQLERWPF